METEEHKLENDTSLEEKGNRGNHQAKDSARSPLPGANMATGGQRILSIIIGLFFCVVAAPVFLIYFIKSPPPLQDVYTFGISYYNLVFIFLISAVGLIFSLLFFLRLRLPIILVIFISCLFCCLSPVIGLKDDLTLQQAILNISFFLGWPFFLRPLYIFIEFMLPLGILIFLFLQFKSIFSKRPHGYAFLGAAFYLTAVAFIGFSGLIQAGQPNIMTALTRYDDIFSKPVKHSTVLKKSYVNIADSGEKVQPGNIPSSGPQGRIRVQSESTLGQSILPVEDSKVAMLDRKVGLLEGKIDRISKELEQMRSSLTGQGQSAPAPLELPPPVVPQNVQPLSEGGLAEIDQNLGRLSDKINQVDESLGKLKGPVDNHQQSAIVDVRHKVDLLTVKLDQLLSRLSQTEYITQRQGPVDKRSGAPSLVTRNQSITSRELAGVLKKIEILSNKVDQISDSFVKKGLYAPQEGRKIE